tara:strand:- start:441 stop:1499 length:1059 start_codon:yes stop_codon:yes gene_type:complete
LKIAIGYKLVDTSWGGGNQFAISLVNAAEQKGYEVTFDLRDNDIDIILLTDPRSYIDGITFGSIDILKYLIFKNKNAIVVHRINECDERKNTNYMNAFLRWANYCADYTVFISSWLRNLNIHQKRKNSKIILNGGDNTIFKDYYSLAWDLKSPLKIVTHHWSPNFMKGFDVYKEIDNLLTTSEWKTKIDFTYIGNLPSGFTFKEARHLLPIAGEELGIELSKNHVYLSASINEPAGMHHIEGALCGLPLIYRESGALPQYCKNYGISFTNNDFLPALKKMFLEYPEFKKRIKFYPYNSSKMTDEYLNLFSDLINNRDNIVKNRNLFNNPLMLIKNFVFLLLKIKNIVRLFNI